MDLTGVFWLSFGIAIVVAFWIGCREKIKSNAYLKAMYVGTPIVFVPGWAAGEAFFWLLPLYLLWFVAGPVAVAYARLFRDDGGS